MTVVTFN